MNKFKSLLVVVGVLFSSCSGMSLRPAFGSDNQNNIATYSQIGNLSISLNTINASNDWQSSEKDDYIFNGKINHEWQYGILSGKENIAYGKNSQKTLQDNFDGEIRTKESIDTKLLSILKNYDSYLKTALKWDSIISKPSDDYVVYGKIGICSEREKGIFDYNFTVSPICVKIQRKETDNKVSPVVLIETEYKANLSKLYKKGIDCQVSGEAWVWRRLFESGKEYRVKNTIEISKLPFILSIQSELRSGKEWIIQPEIGLEFEWD